MAESNNVNVLRVPFDVPNFNHSGILPPFLGPTPTDGALMSPYETTLARIAARLCTSNERKEIFRGLLKYRKELASLGLVAGFQWLSGSFMEDIETLEKRGPKRSSSATHKPPRPFRTIMCPFLPFVLNIVGSPDPLNRPSFRSKIRIGTGKRA
jgi:hypothetical protein